MDKILLDANILVDFLRDNPDEKVVAELVAQKKDRRVFCACDNVLGEFIAGLSPSQYQKVRPFLNDLQYLEGTRQIACSAGYVYWQLARRGKTTSLADCFIATIAKFYRAAVVTRDKKHFKNLSQWVEVNFVQK